VSVLVVYASRYGSTRGIAERIAAKLGEAGQTVELRPAQAVGDLAGHDAYVIGSGVYNAHWLKEAAELVRRNRGLLAERPVWLFSSGPLGTATEDARGRDLRVAAEPRELAEFKEAINPRDHRVFFGALNASKLEFTHRMIRKLPAARAALPDGDFRDWQDIGGWAESIAHELAVEPTAAGAPEEVRHDPTSDRDI
jgi:menaquinone-dependent protoporphyrinogen oxidase